MSKCYIHAWRWMATRFLLRGPHQGSWRWRTRCRKCGKVAVFYTTYPPEIAVTEKPDYPRVTQALSSNSQ